MKHSILVYETVPEHTDMYIFTDATDEQESMLMAAQGTLINSIDMTPAQEGAAAILSEFLEKDLPANVKHVEPLASLPLVFKSGDVTLYFAGFLM